jgi:alkylhydroperoxidase family enzyme
MARIEYPDVDGLETGDLVARIAHERGGQVINLYRMLLHSPPVAEGWRALGTAIRTESSLDDRSRELAICLVARLTGSAYEWTPRPDRRPGGSRRAGTRRAAALAGPRRLLGARLGRPGVDRGRHGRPAADRHVLRAAREVLDDRELVELTATAGFYACVARFVLALDVDDDEQPGAPLPSTPGGDGTAPGPRPT